MKTPVLVAARTVLTLVLAATIPSACSESPITPAPVSGPSFSAADLNAPTGPFPSDRFTVADPDQKTGRRIHLPLPDCAARPTDCEDVAVLNTLDGFNLQPRISIPFDGPIDLGSVTSESIFLIALGDALTAERGTGRKVGINQIVWDPATHTLHAESDELLAQHTRYALIVSRAVRHPSGAPIEVTTAFRDAREAASAEYRQALVEAVRLAGLPEEEVAAATIFTTQSATAILEKIRDQIKAGGVERAEFGLGPDGSLTLFERRQVASITWSREITVGAPTPMPLAVGLLDLVPGAVGRIAFGRFRSPDYMVHPGEFIPSVPTASGVPAVQGWNDIYFNLFLPSGAVPAGGWPVVIIGHGSGQAKEGFPLGIAATMAERGLASVAINAVGHGGGAASTITVSLAGGGSVTFKSGGRGIDQNGNGAIGSPLVPEGIDARAPRTILRDRDGLRQTVVDLMQLVRVIETGVDVDRDGSWDLDPSRIYYVGHSLGGMYGAQFFAVDPSVRAAVLNVPVALQAIRGTWSPVFRASRGIWLDQRIPSLINPPGLAEIGGIPVGPPRYNENLPMRNEATRVNNVAGAMAIQRAFENIEWAAMPGDAIAYMPHLRKAPLAGVPPRPVLIQFAKGDQNVPNPITSMMLRAGGLADVTTYYLHDLARAENGALPANGHGFMPATSNLAFREIALGAQRQIATFFASGGSTIIHPEPQRFFEVSIRLPLPEEFNYIR
jgi:hypothetical protein